MNLKRENEIDRNYMAFKAMLDDLLPDHLGEYVLLRHGSLVDFFMTAGEAERAGAARFADGIYSYQLVLREPVDLGFYSYVLAHGEA